VSHPDNTSSDNTSSDVTLIVLGGDAVAPDLLDGWGPPARVVAADSGIDQAHRLGLVVDVAVGDSDSVSDDVLARAVAEGAAVERLPSEKAETDMVLALDVALRNGWTDLVVVGGEGGRLDHLIANALVMSSSRYASLRLRALGSDGARLHVVRDATVIAGTPGEYLSLLPVHGAAVGVRTHGLRFPLHGERLEAGGSRGVSNELSGPEASVSLDEGVLLAVLPGPSHTPTHTRGTH